MLSCSSCIETNENSLWTTSCLVYNLPTFWFDALVILREYKCREDTTHNIVYRESSLFVYRMELFSSPISRLLQQQRWQERLQWMQIEWNPESRFHKRSQHHQPFQTCTWPALVRSRETWRGTWREHWLLRRHTFQTQPEMLDSPGGMLCLTRNQVLKSDSIIFKSQLTKSKSKHKKHEKWQEG